MSRRDHVEKKRLEGGCEEGTILSDSGPGIAAV